MTSRVHIVTSESVKPGHPDKVCDYIADSILDAIMAIDPLARVAIEVLAKGNLVVVAGEVSTTVQIDYAAVVREAVAEIGYVDDRQLFTASKLHIFQAITRQAPEIGRGVDALGAGDQGVTYGYATNETSQLMPLPILLAHSLSRSLEEDRCSAAAPWLLPDGKTQVSVRYENSRPVCVERVLVSTHHRPEVSQAEIRSYVQDLLLPSALGDWFHPRIDLQVNPTGSFTEGGPSVDAGVTGRKLQVDSYGGAARHGGGAFSGKDPTKVDRSAAYFARFVARQVVKQGLADRAEVSVAYAIGQAQPFALDVDTFGTGDQGEAEAFVRQFDFSPTAIIERLDLRRPIYRHTTNFGHFKPGLPWES